MDFPHLPADQTSSPAGELPAAQRVEANTITFKRSHLYAVLLPLAFVAGMAVGYMLWGRSTSMPAAAVSPTATPQKYVRYKIPEDGDPAIGAQNAPITIVEFSDFECPYCKQWHDDVFKKLMSHYDGKIRFVYRDFPLSSLHENAVSAAEAADCALEQNQYWKYFDQLFERSAGLGTNAYLQYAHAVGLNEDQFKECITARKYQQEVADDYAFAANLGISSTPTFFINGLAVVGAQPYEVFQSIIDQELAGTLPQ